MKSAFLSLCLACLFVPSCATTNDNPRNRSRAQFLDEVWLAPELEGKSLGDLYSKIHFAEVNIGYLKNQGWWAAQNLRTQEHLDEDARMLGRYMRAALTAETKRFPVRRLEVVERPGPDTVIVECAITELVPTKAFWNAAATAAGFVVSGLGNLGTFGKGVIGIEGQLRDGRTGRVIATFRHRDTDQFAVVSLAAYTWYHGCEANIDALAKKAAELFNTSTDTIVNSSRPLKLIAF